jgi:hypothetical protein
MGMTDINFSLILLSFFIFCLHSHVRYTVDVPPPPLFFVNFVYLILLVILFRLDILFLSFVFDFLFLISFFGDTSHNYAFEV